MVGCRFELPHRLQLSDAGCQRRPEHAIQDVDNNGTPNFEQGGVPAIWLRFERRPIPPAPGETDGQPSFGADGE